ncbi:alpha/beta hydrolase [Streptomyces olivoreticuli]
MSEVNGPGPRYERSGSGEPVLLVGRSLWQPHQVPALVRAGYEAITLDGPERADEIASLVGELGTGPCRLVGFSAGARLVQEVLARHPEVCTQAVLLATRGRPDPVGDAMLAAERAFRASGVELPPEYQAFLQAALHLAPGTRQQPELVLDWLDLFEAAARSGSAPLAPDPGTGFGDQLAALAGVSVPVLVVGFQHDTVVRPQLGREVAAALPRGRYAEIEGCGHYGALEQPAALNGALLEFFGEPQR